MTKKLLAVVAHPDDETFGFGGTLAKYAKEGVEIHVLCVTHGEHGEGEGDLKTVRAHELLRASTVLGVAKVEFLNYTDGCLCNDLYHEVAKKIEAKIKEFKPQVVLTFDNLGISGHLDHIFVSLVTTFVCRKYQKKMTLFYLSESKKVTEIFGRFYYIFFPPGRTEEEMDVVVDISHVWDVKVKAMKEHKSQAHDARRILLLKRFFSKHEYFVRAFGTGKKSADLFGT